jgi:hypothetical protein
VTVLREEYKSATELLEPYEGAPEMMKLLTAVCISQRSGVVRHCCICHDVQLFNSLLVAPMCHDQLMHVQEWQSVGDGQSYGVGVVD